MTQHRLLHTALLFLCTVFPLQLSSPAWAEEEEEADLVEATEKVEKKRYDDAFFDAQGTKVIFNKFFDKQSRSEVSVFGSVLPFGSILFGGGGGGSYTYHFTDSWAWEAVNGMYVLNSYTNFAQAGLIDRGLQINKASSFITTNAMWNGIYGKLRLLGAVVMRFDFYGLVGGGVAFTNIGGMKGAASIGLGVRVFVNDYLSLRAEFRDIIYPDTLIGISGSQNKDEIKNNFTITAGASFFFPTFERADTDE